MTEQHVTIESLVEYLHGELAPEQDATAHAHIAACAACAQAYARETVLTEALRSHARAQERELPAGVVARIRSAVTQEGAPPRAYVRRVLHPFAIAASIAAGILLGSVFSLATWHSHARASTIDASYYLDDHAALAASAPWGEDEAPPVAFTSSDPDADEREDPGAGR